MFGPATDLGRQYLGGRLRQQRLEGEFAPSARADVPRYEDFPAQDRARWCQRGAELLEQGEVAFSVLAAGASSRMDLRSLPKAVSRMLEHSGQADLPTSKALVPVTELDGHVWNYLDLYLRNVVRFAQATRARGPAVVFVSEANGPEILDQLEATSRQGLAAERLLHFAQPLEPQIVATEADARRAARNFPEDKLDEVLEISRQHAGCELAQRKPAGHGEFLHQLVSSGTLSQLLAQGVQYISVRNIDNTAALLDRVWLTALGYLQQTDGHMLVEVSQRPVGQKGGALIRRGERWRLAEDPSFAGTKYQASDSYYINNAVAILRTDYFFPIYDTSADELLDAYRDVKQRGARLASIAQRGRAKFPTLIEAKPVTLADGRIAAAVLPETNMWESTGVDDRLRIVPFAVDSDRDAGDDLLEQSDEQQRRRALRVRFSPTKNWDDYEHPRKQLIATHLAERTLKGDLLAESI